MAPPSPSPPPPPPLKLKLKPADREILTCSKARFQLHMIRESGLMIDSIYVRAAVLKPVVVVDNDDDAPAPADANANANANANNGRPRHPQFLMLRRAGPDGVYELPGGYVAEDKDSIGEALGRHVCRLTGLKVRHVLGRLGDVTVPSPLARADGTGVSSATRASIQVSYVVDVEGVPVDGTVTRLDADEYSEAVWVHLDLFKKLPMADETHSLVEQALEVWAAPDL